MKHLLIIPVLLVAVSMDTAAQHFHIDTLRSNILQQNKIHLDPTRKVYVYLPPSYAMSKQPYPVVYYFHSIYSSAEQLIKASSIDALVEKAFQQRRSKEFILVIPDCSGPTAGSFYENSPTTGRWLDYITAELIPYIDRKYRTIPRSDSRAVTGDFMGGRGALVLAITHPETAGIVYALHPVATGLGAIAWARTDINWERVYQAGSFSDLSNAGGLTSIFVAIQQAFLSDTTRPPFYCKWMLEKVDGRLKVNVENMLQAKDSFLLDHYLIPNRQHLTQLKAIAFDWGRFDGNQDHVISAQNFSRQLLDFGIEHEAEEYAGLPWTNNWSDSGRFYTRTIPFLSRHLVFAGKN